jgi:type VI protein secretion system component Hcp
MKKTGLLFSLLLCCTLAFSQSIFLDAGPNVATDAPEGQPVLSYSFGTAHDVTVTLVTGIMSPALMQAAVSGTSFAKMEIKVYNSQDKVNYKITLQDVMVTSFQQGTGLTETVTLSSNKIRIKDSSH